MSYNILEFNHITTLLNKLYTPVCKGGKPAIIISKSGRESKQYIQMECIRQKSKVLKGDLSVKIDFCLKSKTKDKDIDSFLKLLFDGMNGYAYEDDKQIVELIVRKHKDQPVSQINVLIQKL